VHAINEPNCNFGISLRKLLFCTFVVLALSIRQERQRENVEKRGNGFKRVINHDFRDVCRNRICLSRGCTRTLDLSESRLRTSIDHQTISASDTFSCLSVCCARHLRALDRHRSIDVNKLCDDIMATSRGILCVDMTYDLFLSIYFCRHHPIILIVFGKI